MTISSRKPKGSSHHKSNKSYHHSSSKNLKHTHSTNNHNNETASSQKHKTQIKYLLSGLTLLLVILQTFQNIENLPISRLNKNKLNRIKRSIIGVDSKVRFKPAQNNNNNDNSGRVGIVEGTGYRFNMPAGVKTMPGTADQVKSVNPDGDNGKLSDGAQKASSSSSSVFSNFGIGRSLESLISKQERAQAEIAKKASGIVKNRSLESKNEISESKTEISSNSVPSAILSSSSPTDKGENNNLFESVLFYGPSKFSSSQGILVQKSVYTPEEVLLSKIDPQLGNLLHEMGNGGNYTWYNNKDKKNCFSSDVVFAKTHKTGGTTVTNMLLRHAEKHQLSVGLPIEHRWELAGYRNLE